MNLSSPFILRPVATTLLTIGIALAGIVAYSRLPVSPLPQVDRPTISVSAQLPGASPEVVASSLATPLERHLGQIADVTEMTSQSSVGSTNVTLQFGLDRDIDGAARDVQAAINAAHTDLPADLKSNPAYRKVNPADAPIIILALTSKTLTQGQLYDSASTILQQKLSQIDGVGQVNIVGSSLPAVRVELNPQTLFKYGIGLEDVRAAIAAANANSPKGAIEVPSGSRGGTHLQLYTNDQARTADQYRDLVIAYRNGNPVFLHDVAEVDDSVENLRNLGLFGGKLSVLAVISRQPTANIITTVEGIKAALPDLEAALPADINVTLASDRTTTIRGSLHDVETTLLISIFLVIAVVFIFLRNPRASLIPAVAVPVSLLGTFGIMYLCGYSLDNLSLMALTISTGFVVDDAIVVMENIARHVEERVKPFDAALQGAREVGFTVLSMSISLIAVFVPLLFMSGLVGRLFREFSVTLSIAVLISMIVSLTVTPMMCARLVKRETPQQSQWLVFRWSEAAFARALQGYERSLNWALSHSLIVVAILLVTISLNIYLIIFVPKGLFPQQDSGGLRGSVQADQSISFQAMKQKMTDFVNIVKAEPEVATVSGFTGGGGPSGGSNSGFIFATLKPLSERTLSGDQVIAKLRGKTAKVPGAQLFLQTTQDLTTGGRPGQAQYQYTLQADSLDELRTWAPKLTEALKENPNLVDVNSDQQDGGLETDVVIDRPTASRLGLTANQIDQTLYDAFGQRQVSVIYNPLNQYHVVMEVAPRYWQSPDFLHQIYVSTSGGPVKGSAASGAVAGTVSLKNTTSTAATIANDTARNASSNSIAATGHGAASSGAAISTAVETIVPFDAFAKLVPGKTPLSVNHQGLFTATTISFNLPPGKSLSDATKAIDDTMIKIGVPADVNGSFQGNAKVFQDSFANEPILLLTAIGTIYIVLGILYESYIHPITILSTIPSAFVGALLALKLFDIEFTLIAGIGIFLLIGIVKKNAIMMIDFALAAERQQGMNSRDAIYEACRLRFRPIMMTTFAALFGALPLAIGFGNGAELRRPLGISVVGGLILSQMLTLYTTPVIYLYFDRMRLAWGRRHYHREAMA